MSTKISIQLDINHCVSSRNARDNATILKLEHDAANLLNEYRIVACKVAANGTTAPGKQGRDAFKELNCKIKCCKQMIFPIVGY